MSTPCPACGGDQATCLTCKQGVTSCTCAKDDHQPVECGLCSGQGAIDSDEVSDEIESNEWREPRSPSFDELKKPA